MPRLSALLFTVVVTSYTAPAALADLVLSSNDGHTVMDDKAALVAPAKPAPDTITVIDVAQYPPVIKSSFEAPGSVVGPPGAIWISKDESWGIVTSATKADPEAKTGGISPDDRVTVFELTASPRVVQTLNAGLGATQVRVSPDGGLALVANRTEGTVSVFTVKDRRLTPAGKVDTSNPKSLPSAVEFVDDRTALLTRGGDNMVNVLHIDGTGVTIDPRPVTTGMAPYSMDINAARTLAVVANMGRGEGDQDSVSLIDLTSKPFRTVGTFGVPSGPEPLKISPDGKFIAIGAENGSTKTAAHPFYSRNALLGLYALDRNSLRKVAEVPVGGWSEAIAFSRDGKTVLVQSMRDRIVEVFRWDGSSLTRGEPLSTGNAGPASFATAW